jgi:hypothetical protein
LSWGVMGAIVMIGVFNFYSYFLPASNIENNRSFLYAEAVGKATPPNSVITICGCGTELSMKNKIYLPYFALRRVYILDWMLGRGLTYEQVRVQIYGEMSKGAAVYFLSDALENGKALDTMLKNHNLELSGYKEFLKTLNFKERASVGAGYYLRRIGY